MDIFHSNEAPSAYTKEYTRRAHILGYTVDLGCSVLLDQPLKYLQEF